MPETFAGLKVAKEIPLEIVVGLLAGKYKLYGGVIRAAEDIDPTGEIVCLIIPVNEIPVVDRIFPSAPRTSTKENLHWFLGQLTTPLQATERLLQASNQIMNISGLPLNISSLSFNFLAQRLTGLTGQLEQRNVITSGLLQVLERNEREELFLTINELTYVIDNHKDSSVLSHAQATLKKLLAEYAKLLEQEESLDLAVAYEELYNIAALGLVLSNSLSGSGTQTSKELIDTNNTWREQAQSIARGLLLGNVPERFLFSDFVQEVPLPTLIEWLDFAYNETKGFGWIDELRANMPSWYDSERLLPANFQDQFQGSNKEMAEFERQTVIPIFQRLVAKNTVLEGYLSQYQFLEANKISQVELTRFISRVAQSETVEGYIILYR